ncbi:MAG: hypothetical protein HUU17_03385 [Chthonomonadales bacterium]|nr:hypothetical protein [Chthonomonadales bacterium]
MEMPCRRTRFSLDGRWSLVLADPDRDDAQTVRTIADVRNLDLPVYEASVPGNLELDLQANGIIPEPFHGRNIADNVRFERCRAIYFRRFRPPEGLGPVVILEAQGLDCYATVMVNGVVLGSADNMLIERRFPIDPSLLAEESEIVVLSIRRCAQPRKPPTLGWFRRWAPTTNPCTRAKRPTCTDGTSCPGRFRWASGARWTCSACRRSGSSRPISRRWSSRRPAAGLRSGCTLPLS